MSAPFRRRPLALCGVLACALTLAACGANTRKTHAETEGVYVNAGPLAYQVQLSRQLNPTEVEDTAYLKGVPAAQASISSKQTWFAVFMRVANETKQTYPTAANFFVVDTKDNVYRPIPVAPLNPFVYQSTELRAGKVYPTAGSIAGEGVIQGSMLLFKLPVSSFENRPLELHILSPAQQEATVTLDV